MRLVFADTFYWTALINPRDEWHQRVQVFSRTLSQTHLVTTDEVLIEFLNFFSSYETYMKSGVVQGVQDILENIRIQVISQTRESFLAGLALYAQRLDKGYSLTDCISMNTMRQLGIAEVLTHDKHFTQEGFAILLQDERKD
jgi:predicted nucleic acid-binding protein